MSKRRGTIADPETVAIEPWPWPYGEQDGFYSDDEFHRLYDRAGLEPWEILARREEVEKMCQAIPDKKKRKQ